MIRLFILAGSFAAYSTFLVVSAQESGSGRSAWEGVYTTQQAQRGAEEYKKHCSACHQTDLKGTAEAPALIGTGVRQTWEGLTVYALWNTIRTTMPLDDPAALSGQAYIDIVTFLLWSNTFPPGTQELLDDAEVLKQLRISKDKN